MTYAILPINTGRWQQANAQQLIGVVGLVIIHVNAAAGATSTMAHRVRVRLVLGLGLGLVLGLVLVYAKVYNFSSPVAKSNDNHNKSATGLPVQGMKTRNVIIRSRRLANED